MVNEIVKEYTIKGFALGDEKLKNGGNKVPINNLEELLKVSMILADKLYDEKNTEILPLSKRKILERK